MSSLFIELCKLALALDVNYYTSEWYAAGPALLREFASCNFVTTRSLSLTSYLEIYRIKYLDSHLLQTLFYFYSER
jgi:hypothetical protein